MKKILTTILIFLSLTCFPQLEIIVNNNLTINHGDMVLYLSDDTCSMISKHNLKYSDFKKLDSDRDNRWFQDTYKGKYSKELYLHSNYDMGHLTPSHITSYNDTLNHNSFSLFNQAPQTPGFNRGKWAQLEKSVEDSISKYKSDVTIITGVIYDGDNDIFMGKSKIKIPVAYFKILLINKKTYYWIGSNNNGQIVPTTLKNLNEIFTINKMNISLK